MIALAGAIAKLLTRELSDAAQLADVASVLRIIREAVRDEGALERIDWCLLDITYFAEQAEIDEREAAIEEKMRGRFRSIEFEERD